jgi:AbrB family looped-hinge helix DNA binding protein
MDIVVLSKTYQIVIPRDIRERLGLRPGTKFTVLEKHGVIYLVPERPITSYRGIASGTTSRGLRDKNDRF